MVMQVVGGDPFSIVDGFEDGFGEEGDVFRYVAEPGDAVVHSSEMAFSHSNGPFQRKSPTKRNVTLVSLAAISTLCERVDLPARTLSSAVAAGMTMHWSKKSTNPDKGRRAVTYFYWGASQDLKNAPGLSRG